jgi:hypothetical protein
MQHEKERKEDGELAAIGSPKVAIVKKLKCVAAKLQ